MAEVDSKSRRAANPEQNKKAVAAYRAANLEKEKIRNALYYAENREKARQTRAAWRAANLEKDRAISAAWRKANPEKKRAYRLNNLEAHRIYKQNRAARKRENGGVLSKGLAEKLFKLQKGKCACCGLPLGDNYHMDHIMPVALGGPNIDSNIQLLRQRCNNQKRDKHPIDYMQSRGFLL